MFICIFLPACLKKALGSRAQKIQVKSVILEKQIYNIHYQAFHGQKTLFKRLLHLPSDKSIRNSGGLLSGKVFLQPVEASPVFEAGNYQHPDGYKE